jgi:hypothetical protein
LGNLGAAPEGGEETGFWRPFFGDRFLGAPSLPLFSIYPFLVFTLKLCEKLKIILSAIFPRIFRRRLLIPPYFIEPKKDLKRPAQKLIKKFSPQGSFQKARGS